MKKPVRVVFKSQGAKVRGLFYEASGIKPLPTVILCHGFPGNDGDVFGLGERLTEEGFNALAFNYRGSWGSEGLFKDANSLEDVVSAIRYVKSSFVVKEFNVNPSRIALIGYSYGGGMALLGSLSYASVKRVVDLAGGNLGEAGRMMKQSDEFRRAIEKSIEEGATNSSLRVNPKEIIAELLADLDKFDLVKHAEKISSKDILIIGGWRDQDADIEHHILPLFRALQRHGAKQVQIEIFDSDHSFTNVRNQLADRIVSWLRRTPKTR
ncbi:alpha/beta fold hydrolase [Candidatus Bathyarchaeota archaeon A05DMB-2]|jgi:dipeptidyl aminopeptidase/acylaminoacyl peptidase|nr:alpha/beta fold hydrolase [Candidatus Bathyarchaeota archaeon A05DMB-2]